MLVHPGGRRQSNSPHPTSNGSVVREKAPFRACEKASWNGKSRTVVSAPEGSANVIRATRLSAKPGAFVGIPPESRIPAHLALSVETMQEGSPEKPLGHTSAYLDLIFTEHEPFSSSNRYSERARGGMHPGTPAIVLVFGDGNVTPGQPAYARTMLVLMPLAVVGASNAHCAIAARTGESRTVPTTANITIPLRRSMDPA